MQAAFDLGPESKHKVLASAADKWRIFKSKLTTKIILPLKDEPELLVEPPPMYSITKRDWTAFVKSRLTDEWEVMLLALGLLYFVSS